jgi:hypothetical protein
MGTVCSSAFTDIVNSKNDTQMREKGIYQKPEVKTRLPKNKTGCYRFPCSSPGKTIE